AQGDEEEDDARTPHRNLESRVTIEDAQHAGRRHRLTARWSGRLGAGGGSTFVAGLERGRCGELQPLELGLPRLGRLEVLGLAMAADRVQGELCLPLELLRGGVRCTAVR